MSKRCKTIEILEQIKEHQMQTVQLAKTTKVYKLADQALKELKDIERNNFKKGSVVKITSCLKGHEFEIGEKVILLTIGADELYLATNYEQEWYLSEDEMELINNPKK